MGLGPALGWGRPPQGGVQSCALKSLWLQEPWMALASPWPAIGLVCTYPQQNSWPDLAAKPRVENIILSGWEEASGEHGRVYGMDCGDRAKCIPISRLV